MMKKLRNRFGLSEWSGSIGDLGTLLPLVFALVAFNGFSISRIFLLFGIMYIISGFIYKVPVSVQPLKAMSVIAISLGLSVDMLAGTAFFYGLLLIVLSLTGAVKWFQKIFSSALVKGIQFGVGLILAEKAIQLIIDKGLFLNTSSDGITTNILLLITFILVISFFQLKKKMFIPLILIFLSMIVFKVVGFAEYEITEGSLLQFSLPSVSILADAFILLIIPQLPLTLGNAMFAASDVCHDFWGNQAKRVTPTRLGMSIGFGNMLIGLFGGFPMCHGAGGIAAHKQFGGNTGGTVIIIGVILILFALVSPLSALLFFIPVPLLSTMLLFDSWRMITVVKKLALRFDIMVAFTVGIISFATRNLTIALVVGLILEHSYQFYLKRQTKTVLIKTEG
jgi:SulP family sulfate permease